MNKEDLVRQGVDVHLSKQIREKVANQVGEQVWSQVWFQVNWQVLEPVSNKLGYQVALNLLVGEENEQRRLR